KKQNLQDAEFVKELFLKQPLSVTALNNYLVCPWMYFYRNLIRLPEAKAPHLMFGTAVHDTLEHLFKRLRRDEHVSQEEFVEFFERTLATHPLTPEDMSVYAERGKKALAGWYDEYSGRWITNTLTEFSVRGVEIAPD